MGIYKKKSYSKGTYAQKLTNPKWQKKRLEVFERSSFMCELCQDENKTLHVHHGYYEPGGLDPWEYPIITLHSVCEDCHTDVQKVTTRIHKKIATLPLEILFDLEKLLVTANFWDFRSLIKHLELQKEKQNG